MTTDPDTLSAVMESCVSVETPELATGSGVVVRHGKRCSYVVTCHHVVKGHRKVKVNLRVGKKFFAYNAIVEKTDEKKDLALLRTARKVGVSAVELAPEAPSHCAEVCVVGHPAGFFGLACQGVLSFVDTAYGYMISGVVSLEGTSGSAVVNTEGGLIGILHSGGHQGNLPVWGICYAVPFEDVRSFLTEEPKAP